MLEALGLGVLSFEQPLQNSQNGQSYVVFNLPKDLTITLISGYSVVMRHRIVTRWQELEARVAAPALPNFGNPAEAARAWALQFERAEQQAQKVIEVSQELARSEVTRAGSKPLHRATQCKGPRRTRPLRDAGQVPGRNARQIAIAQGCS